MSKSGAWVGQSSRLTEICLDSMQTGHRIAGGGALDLNLRSLQPLFQNSDGHSFLTKEELLQKCAQKTPRVSIF